PNDLIIGAKVFVLKDEKEILAEILAKNLRKGKQLFYVHYVNYNKRLDQWININQINLKKPVIRPDDPTSKTDKITAKKGKASSSKTSKTSKTSKASKESKDIMDLDDLDVQGLNLKDGLTRNQEIEKLRSGGSRANNHLEVSKIRNLNKIIMGKFEVEPWYFSPYPIELTEEDEIYICEYTLQYFGFKKQFERFRSKCTLRHPPGNEIYRDDLVSFFEIDGKKQRIYCRNLCLLSKLFLDHKTLYYDVDPFLFYCMTIKDEEGYHLVGYFSKEKESAEGYNLACILTLPQYQRHGYGKILIQFSYELSKREHKVGSPEKPLSDLGLLSYRAYWSETIVKLLIGNKRSDITIDEISSITSMTTADILHTLQTLNMLRYYKGQHIIVLTDQVIEQYEKLKKKKRHYIDSEKLVWKPPTFTASQLRFGW
ncbi:NuA4 histone acetyltransferase complex catalytic subunit ESA1, partial [Ascoidea rubescens DSM 1968]